jgi:tetratricopeptide (TPR) repeat protein
LLDEALGRYDEAITCSQQALVIAREVDSVRDQGYALSNLGRAHLELGRLAEATDLFEQALAHHRAARDRYGEAQDLQRTGTVYAQAGRLAEARAAWTQARSLFEAFGEEARAAELGVQLEQLGAAD